MTLSWKRMLTTGTFLFVWCCSSVCAQVAPTPTNAYLQDLQKSGETRRGLSRWTKFSFSNPAHHDPMKFVYLVHGLTKDFLFTDKKSPDAYLNSKPLISASLIDGKRRGTFGNWGFIITTNMKSIVQVFNEDASSNTFNAERIRKLKALPISFSPQKLLDASGPSRYNEVLIEPENSGEMKVVGVFAKTMGEGAWFIKDDLKEKVMALAKKFGLPIVEINTYGD